MHARVHMNGLLVTVGLHKIAQHKHRRNFVYDDGDHDLSKLSQPLLKVVVTVTTTFSKWNLQFFKQL